MGSEVVTTLEGAAQRSTATIAQDTDIFIRSGRLLGRRANRRFYGQLLLVVLLLLRAMALWQWSFWR